MASIRLPSPGDPIRAGDLAEIARVAGHSHSGPGVSVHGGNVTFLGPPPVEPGKPKLLGKLDADLTAGSSATMSIWEGSTLADSGRNVTVYDWFLPTGKKIASGAKVAAFWNSGKWYVDTTDTCPT